MASNSPPQAGTAPLRFWDVATGKQLGSLNGKIDSPGRLCYSPDGKSLAVGTMTKKVILWDVEGEKVQATLNRNPDWVTALSFSPDGRILASGEAIVGLVVLWDPASLKPLARLDVNREMLHADSLAFSPDSKLLAIAGRNSQAAHLVDLKAEREIAVFPAPKRDGGVVAFSPDGKLLVTGSGTGKIAIWEVPEKK